MQTPMSPVSLACAHAANAASSSWRVWMKSGASSAWKARFSPFEPSPG
jgi:hypothetical protein